MRATTRTAPVKGHDEKIIGRKVRTGDTSIAMSSTSSG